MPVKSHEISLNKCLSDNYKFEAMYRTNGSNSLIGEIIIQGKGYSTIAVNNAKDLGELIEMLIGVKEKLEVK